MRDLLPEGRPALVLAPMQEVTDLAFMHVISRRGGPDWFVTEYFRVHPQSRLDPVILRSISDNRSGRPVFAQMIGQDIEHLARTARELGQWPVAGIDINLGCPAPVVCRKNAGGGLLRDLQHLDRLLGRLREAVQGRFTIKTRIGYDDAGEFARLLELFSRHRIDGLSVHGRTVRERYQSPVHARCVRMAVGALSCPVIANGNVVDVETGLAYLAQSGAAGLMIGRGAIRNPWIFAQLAAVSEGRTPPAPSHRDLLDYVADLYEETGCRRDDFEPRLHVQAMKRLLVYISHGLGDGFEPAIRRVTTPDEFFAVCRHHLDHDTPLPARPPEDSKLFCGFADLLARPA